MSEPPEPNTPDVESAEAGFLDLDILVETPVAHKGAGAASKEDDAKAKTDGAADGAGARPATLVLQAMPIVDLGTKSAAGEEAVEVGSHGVRRAPLSTRPLPPRPGSVPPGPPRATAPAVSSPAVTPSFPPPPVRRAASVPSPPPAPAAASVPAPLPAPPAASVSPPPPAAVDTATAPAPPLPSFPPPPPRPAGSAPPPPLPVAAAARAPGPPTSGATAPSPAVAAPPAASPASERHPTSIVPPDSPAASEASDLTSIAVLEPESNRLVAAVPLDEPAWATPSRETATPKTAGRPPPAEEATPAATPPTAAAPAASRAAAPAEPPPTPTDTTAAQVSAETPVSPAKVDRPASNLAMVPTGPATTDELEASEVTIDDALPSEPTLVRSVKTGGAAVTDATPAPSEAAEARTDHVEAPSNRISEIPPEVDPEDLEITDAPFVAGQFPLPPLPLPSYARPDLAAAVEAERATEDPTIRRARYWWDEMFGDDFLRTMDRLTDQQIRKEVNFIEESLGVQQGAIILDLACGTGRHAVELAARGYNVVGYDLSVAMLARAADEAHDRNQKLNFLQGDMRDMGFEEMFDAVYCWATSFGYFDDEKNQLVAQRIHRALRKDGMLLLDVANRDFVAKVQPSLVWFEGEGCVCMDDMRVDFISSRLKVKRMIMIDDGRTRELDYSIRLYTLHELGNMLHDVGFKVIEVSGHTSTPRVFMGADSSRLLVLAEKA